MLSFKIFIHSLQRRSDGSGPDSCPRINAMGDVIEILVPHGSKKAIKARVQEIGEYILQERFVCQFNIEGRAIRVKASLLNNTVICDFVEFAYTSNATNVTVPFDVLWGGSNMLGNPNNIHGKRFRYLILE